MSSRIITNSETDAATTLVFSGDLLEIDGPGSLLTPNIVALEGATLSMTGGTLTATGTLDPTPGNGLDGLSLNGSATFDAAVVNSAGRIAIGSSGDTAPSTTGTLTVDFASTVTAAATVLGDWATGGQDVGSLTLIGAGTTWHDTGDPGVSVAYGAMIVGASGIGHLNIRAGATAEESTFAAIGNGSASKGDATVDGAGSVWKINTNLVIGALGTGALTVSNNATVSVKVSSALAFDAEGSGSVTIDSGGTFAVTSKLFVGYHGKGTLSDKNGGKVSAAEVDISHFAGSTGTVTVDGATLSSTGSILVGESASGTLDLQNTASVTGTDVAIGYAGGTASMSTASVDSNSTLAASGTLFVGLSGPGTLEVAGGGSVTANLLVIAGTQDGGTDESNSSVTVNGAKSVLKIDTDAFIDSANREPDAPGFTNGQFGRWAYSSSGIGGIQVGSGGFLTIGHLLDLQESTDQGAPESLRVFGDGSAEIGGNASVAPSTLAPGTLTIDASGVLAGHGRVVVADGPVAQPDTIYALINNGPILAQDGTLAIEANVSGDGTLLIAQDAAADINGDFAGTVQFNGAYDTTLRLWQPDPTNFQGTLDNLQIGDVISLNNAAFPATLSHTEISGSSLDLTFRDGSTWNYDLAGDYSGDTFAIHQREIIRNVNGTLKPQPYTELILEPVSPKIETGFSGQPTDGANPYVDSLVWGWGQWLPGSGPISYWFGDQSDVKPAVLAHGESTEIGPDTVVDTWMGTEQAAFLSALGVFASVSGLTFQAATSPDTADVIWWLKPGLTVEGQPFLGLSEVPAEVPGGPIWQFFDDTPWRNDPNQLTFGGDGEDTIIHELGHTLGLAHPGDGGDEPDETTFPGGPSDPQNQSVFTVMSGFQGWAGASAPATPDHGTQGGLGALDIAAIQTLYGANTSTGAGDTTYTLPTANQVGTGWQAIWDPNGFNTISNAGGTLACHIDLRAAPLTGPNAGGFPSYVLGVQGGFTIADGTEVDGAIGGTGDDVFVTNAGPDLIVGGGGVDRVYFAQNFADYTVLRTGNSVAVTLGSVTDTLENIFQLSFADQDVFAAFIPCFAEGTRIATDGGDAAVETLSLGDRALALVGEKHVPLPVTWIGRRHIDLARHREPELVQPIRIRRDAFAPGQPARDLLVSPDHAIFIEGGLIPARLLVNGGSIAQECDWRSVTYYHVELAEHAIILAEGLPVESYLDTGNRGAFENGGEPLMLHAAFSMPNNGVTREDDGCAPLVTMPSRVQPIWRLLAGRAASIGHPPAMPEATYDPELRLGVDGRPLRPVLTSDDRCVFVLPRGAREARLMSRAARPTETRPWVDDSRRLGVRISRIRVTDQSTLTDVALDSPALGEGWWAVETEGLGVARWTSGDARLVLPPGPTTYRVLTLWLAGSTTYPVRATPELVPARKAA
jgi:T5SS/PEP-CTERM-associated repeat protein